MGRLTKAEALYLASARYRLGVGGAIADEAARTIGQRRSFVPANSLKGTQSKAAGLTP